MFVVIGKQLDTDEFQDYFICELDENREIGTEEEVKQAVKDFDKLYGKDYSYHAAKLTFLD